MTRKLCPHCRNGVPLYRFNLEPRFSVPGWDETMLFPVKPPPSYSSDWARCSGTIEDVEWLEHDVRTNVPLEHPKCIIAIFGPIVSTALGYRSRKRGYPLPSRLPEDTRDPIVIVLEIMVDLVSMARQAIQSQSSLPVDQLVFLICQTEAALRLKGCCGIDLRFDILEALRSLLHALAGFEVELTHAS